MPPSHTNTINNNHNNILVRRGRARLQVLPFDIECGALIHGLASIVSIYAYRFTGMWNWKVSIFLILPISCPSISIGIGDIPRYVFTSPYVVPKKIRTHSLISCIFFVILLLLLTKFSYWGDVVPALCWQLTHPIIRYVGSHCDSFGAFKWRYEKMPPVCVAIVHDLCHLTCFC